MNHIKNNLHITQIDEGILSNFIYLGITLPLLFLLLLLTGCGARQGEEVTVINEDSSSVTTQKIQDISDVKIGMQKNDITQEIGKPDEWVTVTSNMEMLVTTYFDLESTKRKMPSGEIWFFEYSLSGKEPFTIHFQDDRVIDVVSGKILDE